MMTRLLLLIMLACSTVVAVAAEQVQGLRASADQQSTRIVLDLSDRVSYQVFTLANPHRVVIDIADTALAVKLNESALRQGPIRGVRSGTRKGDDLRLVMDVVQRVEPKAFLLEPQDGTGHRLVVDFPGVGKASGHQVATTTSAKKTPHKHQSKTAPESFRDVVVVIDAGHGGKDSGCLGKNSMEKDIALSLCKLIKEDLNNLDKDIEVILSRDKDIFIPLHERSKLANDVKADLFISVHCNGVNQLNSNS